MSGSGNVAVLFDLDGTLVDTAVDIASAVDTALAEMGRASVGVSTIKTFVGNGAAPLIHRSLTGRRDGTAPQALFDECYDRFKTHYSAGICVDSRPFPGVVETLDALRERGTALGCVTNKPRCFTEPLLESLGLDRYFAVTVSGDTLGVKKPDPAPLIHAAEALGVTAGQSIMVGDSPADIGAARNAGAVIVCVDYGYADIEEITALAPDHLVASTLDVLDLPLLRR